jgi:hypothetical protein
MSEKGVELRSTDSPFGSAQGRVGAASPTWDFRSIYKCLAGLVAVFAGRGPFGKLRAGSSTPHLLSLRESRCSAQDDNFGEAFSLPFLHHLAV